MNNEPNRRFARSTETRHPRIQSLREGEKKREIAVCKVSASFTAPRAAARENKKGELQRDAEVPSGSSFERRFLAESGRNAEADFTNECHLTIRLVG